jgi:hypothetical protein
VQFVVQFFFCEGSNSMKYLNLMTPGLLIAALWTSGCSSSSDSTPAGTDAKVATSAAPVAEHAHGTGPNGGVVMDLGSHHAEFTVNHGKHECTILVLGDDEKTPTAVAATDLILIIQETKTADGTVVAPMTITMSPVDAADGKASTFVGSDPGIGNVADFAGSVSGEIDGKPAMGEFQE